MNIIICLLPSFFIEKRGQIAPYIGSENLKVYVFVSNIETVEMLKLKAREMQKYWIQSGSPEDCPWVPLLYTIVDKEINDNSFRPKLMKGQKGITVTEQGLEIYFPHEVPEKIFVF